jgi:hypothetical protein
MKKFFFLGALVGMAVSTILIGCSLDCRTINKCHPTEAKCGMEDCKAHVEFVNCDC